MKRKRRIKLVVVLVSAVVILPLLMLLILSGAQTGTVATQSQGNETVLKTGQQRSARNSDNTSAKKTEQETQTEKETEAEADKILSQQNTEKMKQPIPSVNSETWQPTSVVTPELPSATTTEAKAQPKTKTHTHSYQLVDTRKVDHPAVTKQVWVVDTAAWDETIRPGYHMSVVTCHQCGAQFSDPAQANALEAWGDHIDASHDGDGSYDMAYSYDIPAETVHHDAVGHYETQVVSASWMEYVDTYRCACGDQYTKTR